MPASRRADLDAFPRPSVAVDVAVMTVTEAGELGVLLHRRSGDRAGTWALPGRFLRERERLASAVERTLSEKCGLSRKALAGRVPRQLHVAHLLALPHARLVPAIDGNSDVTVALIRRDRLVLPDGQKGLPYGQDEIVARAHAELRDAYRDILRRKVSMAQWSLPRIAKCTSASSERVNASESMNRSGSGVSR